MSAAGRKPGEALVLTPRPGWEIGSSQKLSRPFVVLFTGWVLGTWLAWILREAIPGWRAWRIAVLPLIRDAARRITPFLLQITQNLKSCAFVYYGAALLFLALILFLWKRFGHKSVLLVILLGTALGMGGAFRHMDRVQSVTPWLDREIHCEGTVGLNPKYGDEKDVYLFQVGAVENGPPGLLLSQAGDRGGGQGPVPAGGCARYRRPVGVPAPRIQSRRVRLPPHAHGRRHRRDTAGRNPRTWRTGGPAPCCSI